MHGSSRHLSTSSANARPGARLRRGEVLGLRWSDIDLRARTLTVRQARVLVDYKVRIEEPKPRNGQRTLPLDNMYTPATMTWSAAAPRWPGSTRSPSAVRNCETADPLAVPGRVGRA